MTNVLHSWPGFEKADMTSPAEVEHMAEAVAAKPDREARKPLVDAYKAEHSAHVMKLVRKRAKQLIDERK